MGKKSPNWVKIEKEYVTTEASLRQLAAKYGVGMSSMNRHSRERGWVAKRKAHENVVADKVGARLVSAEADEQSDRALRVMQVSDKLLDLCEKMCDMEGIAPRDLRSLTAALMDIKEIQMIKSALDIREQQARIKNLEKAASPEDEDTGETGVIILPEVLHG